MGSSKDEEVVLRTDLYHARLTAARAGERPRQ
jgi:hypothetical protein